MRNPPDDPIAHRLVCAAAAASLFGGDPETVTVGRYEVRRWLGSGASGVVYAAWDPSLQREVALKVLRAAPTSDRVFDEARALARLAHPGVVTVHDVGVHDGYVFVAMARVDGPTLRTWSRDRADADVFRAWLAVGRALEAAHAAGIVHRDVKPDNVVVGPRDEVTLVDFGLACAEGVRVGPAGTPAYMAPEQRRGEDARAASDQFAFAVSMAETLQGQLSRRVQRALDRARADDPEDRFPHLGALLGELTHDPLGRVLSVAMSVALAAFVVISLVAAVMQMIVFSRSYG